MARVHRERDRRHLYITARVASAGTAVGDLRVLLDGVVLGTIPVNATGGWQTYTDATLPAVTIAGGSNRVLRLEVVNGGIST